PLLADRALEGLARQRARLAGGAGDQVVGADHAPSGGAGTKQVTPGDLAAFHAVEGAGDAIRRLREVAALDQGFRGLGAAAIAGIGFEFGGRSGAGRPAPGRAAMAASLSVVEEAGLTDGIGALRAGGQEELAGGGQVGDL